MKRTLQELWLAAWAYWHVQHSTDGLRLVGPAGARRYRCCSCGSTCVRPEPRR